ncbi:unnamed protein product [Macrosiphum euphorbiae]|uniref:Bromodomain associated domain-containing protein n=1 Tax=Macrosiphum euphorbiae TaxID=13131 RepID=A0AAV0W361_9HEMI|nr:unnamed protein product [Macrosiphum euphorbiae]
MSSDNTSNQSSEVMDYVCKTSREKDCSGAMDPVLAGKNAKRRRRAAYIMQPTPISLSRSSEDFNHGFSSRARFYGAMAAKRLKGIYLANIAAAAAEVNGPTDLVDQITEFIFQRLVRALGNDIKNTVKRRRPAYIMQPTQISLSRPEEDLDHIFSSRAQFYGAMAAKRLKAHYYGNIGFAKTERNVPINDLVDQIPAGSTFRRLVENCVRDLARNACVPECAQNMPAQVSTVEIVDPVTIIENDQDVSSGQTTESGIQVHEQEVPPAASVEIKVKRKRTLWSHAKKLFSRMICCRCTTAD